jgi:hypothetical protein
VLLASEASTAVIFRRGPSRWTRLYLWNTKTDEITPGSWFAGRLYEFNSDLSPDGEHLIYFARNEAKWRREAGMTKFGVDLFHSWTALCRPPWVKAIGLWSVSAGCTGGGFFSGNRRLQVYNADSRNPTLLTASGFTATGPEAGQHVPTMLASMLRTGWREISPGLYSFIDPLLPLTLSKQDLELRLSQSFNFKLIRHYLWHGLLPAPELDTVSWADLDQQGRLVYARKGRLFAHAEGHEIVLADLNLDQPLERPEEETTD